MSENETTLLTQHAMLVAWGEYAQSLGLVKKIAGVPLEQKAVEHSPQRKVLEFFVAILGGLPYLKDISRSAHPLDQDRAVAKAWGQELGGSKRRQPHADSPHAGASRADCGGTA